MTSVHEASGKMGRADATSALLPALRGCVIGLLLSLAILIMGAMGCATRGSDRRSDIADNFAVVAAGTNGVAGIYRSGTPTAAGWEALRGMGVVRSVNLDTTSDPVVSGIVSRQFAMDAWQQMFGPVGPQLEAALLEVGPGTIVHCAYGANRTGTLVILYRMRVCGWSKARAIAEADGLGWGNSMPALKEYVEREPDVRR